MPPKAAKVMSVPAEETRQPYPLAHDSVYVTGSSPLDALKRTVGLVERVLASNELIQLDQISFQVGVEEDPDSFTITFCVPGSRDRRWLTKERLDEILKPAAVQE
jgi:hypothetical protein